MKGHNQRGLVASYIILRAIVVLVMLDRIINRDFFNVFMCLITLFLFMIPSMFEHRLKIDVPDPLEIIILMFIFAAEILGEIAEFYIRVPHWDTMLHTVNGFLMAAIGVAMIDILNRNQKLQFSMSPIFEAVMAFCFSMTIGVIWEFFEYAMDIFFLSDMQKDTIVNAISSVAINPQGVNSPIIVSDIIETVISTPEGQMIIKGGYLDIGLHDTMKDLLVNLVGAVVFSIIGVFYFRSRGREVKGLIPRRMTAEEHNELTRKRKGRRNRLSRKREPQDAPQDEPDASDDNPPQNTTEDKPLDG